MEVSGQLHTPAFLSNKYRPVIIWQETEWTPGSVSEPWRTHFHICTQRSKQIVHTYRNCVQKSEATITIENSNTNLYYYYSLDLYILSRVAGFVSEEWNLLAQYYSADEI
jgi:hypothetical protein